MGYSPSSAIALSAFGAPTANIPMGSHKFTGLLDGTTAADSAGWDQLPTAGNQYAYVVSGCVWTPDAVGSTLLASMTIGSVCIGGLLYPVGAVAHRAFTASDDTYIDVAISGGNATITYTAVPGNTTSPALANSGTMLNTVRIGMISAGASSLSATSVFQGQIVTQATATAQGSTTVAAGSNGANITATPLDVAASTSFPSGGGQAQVAHSGGQTYTIAFTGTGAGTLTGVTVISGSGTVSTGDTVTGITPILVTDMLGNLIYPTTPYPRIIGYALFNNTQTTTLTSAIPVPSLIAPFILLTPRVLRVSITSPVLSSSAAAGTQLIAVTYLGNAASGGSTVQSANPKVAVASDGGYLSFSGISYEPTPATYTAQASISQNAAGTLTLGVAYGTTQIYVEAM